MSSSNLYRLWILDLPSLIHSIFCGELVHSQLKGKELTTVQSALTHLLFWLLAHRVYKNVHIINASILVFSPFFQ